MHDDQVDVTTEIVATLIQEQFPPWRGKAIRLRVIDRDGQRHLPHQGTVSPRVSPLRLADPAETLAVLEQEARASAELAKASRFPAPEPVALGKPGAGYPMPWSVQTWGAGNGRLRCRPEWIGRFCRRPCGLHRSFCAALRRAGGVSAAKVVAAFSLTTTTGWQSASSRATGFSTRPLRQAWSHFRVATQGRRRDEPW
ncbi:phosphotransferase [Streptomyces sp. KL116D]|uniref:phosphotransferase n=1 Tax=Streptomyces sp. KL116D TaxID=3045152 RepID=UPI003557352B